MIRVACAQCGRVGEYHPGLAGTRVKCKGCPGWLQLETGDDGQPQRCESCGFQVKVGRMNACPQCGKRFAGAPQPPTPHEEPKPTTPRPPVQPVVRDSAAEQLAILPVLRESEPPNRIGLAIVCLHISAALYCVLALVFLLLFLSIANSNVGFLIGFGIVAVCVSLAVGLELVVAGLKEREFWAWVVGLCVFVLYTPSLFFILGVLGLWGLLDSGSRAAFGMGENRRT